MNAPPEQNSPRAGGAARGAIVVEFPVGDAVSTADDAGTASGSVPTITVEAGALHQLATVAEDALLRSGVPFYVRGAELVRPVVEDTTADKGGTTTTARLVAVTPDALVDHLSRAATWVKFDGRKGRNVPTDPPRPVAATVLSRDGEWRFPQLAGLITTQTLRPDGTVLGKPGYDPATRLLLVNPPAMRGLPVKPTRQHAERALALLLDLLSGFPFVDDASRSVALSALITPVVRGAMPVAPLHAMRAPTPGSGKSFLVDIASAIATGQRCPVIAAGRTEEENQKRLGAALLAGQPLVSIDNLNGELSGDALCQMVERPVVEVRPLGRSELVRIESRATMFATGNNLIIVGDMVRRCLLCSLDPQMEQPELRQFRNDPFAKVLAKRGAYIAAALTIVRAYACAGYPDPLPALGSFEAWSRLVRSALGWLGQADPVKTMEISRSEDPEMAGMREVFGCWKAAIGVEKPLGTGEIVAAADPKTEVGARLREALVREASDGHTISALRLGHWLGRRKDRIVNGLKAVGNTDPHSKALRWRLVEL